MRFTPCECEKVGWCERHKCEKGQMQFYLCRTSERHFQLWEEGKGLGQGLPQPKFRRLPLERCQHRSIEPIEKIECDLCGSRKRLIPVFSCEKFTECSEQRIGTRAERLRNMPCCLTCGEYIPIDPDSIPTNSS
mgnify:CR=1 FL=1|tara:strand:- start:577 stop:978 length:402 start_codon:yes stop_codon:yes gene_type:complete